MNATIKWGATKAEQHAKRLAELTAKKLELEAEEERLAAAEAEGGKAVERAVKNAAHARCAAVEQLYEGFGIEEQLTQRKKRDGSYTSVRSDANEVKRAALLVDAIRQAMAELEELRAAKASAGEPSDDQGQDGEEEAMDPVARDELSWPGAAGISHGQ